MLFLPNNLLFAELNEERKHLRAGIHSTEIVSWRFLLKQNQSSPAKVMGSVPNLLVTSQGLHVKSDQHLVGYLISDPFFLSAIRLFLGKTHMF
jgi:hypothetical protein